MKKCVILEMKNSNDFENTMNKYLNYGYKFEASSCNGKYYKEPIACNLVSYGSNIVASVKDEYREIVEMYLRKYEFYHCFETPNMHWLDDQMKENGYRVCFMAEYFLPDVNALKRRECNYHLKVLEQKDFANL